MTMTPKTDSVAVLREVVKRLRVLAVAISLPQRRNRKDELRWCQALTVDADDIESVLAALSAQGEEPVAWQVFRDGVWGETRAEYVSDYRAKGVPVRALYLHPAPPGSDAVTEALVDSVRADIMQAAANAGHSEIVLQDEWVHAALTAALAARTGTGGR